MTTNKTEAAIEALRAVRSVREELSEALDSLDREPANINVELRVEHSSNVNMIGVQYNLNLASDRLSELVINALYAEQYHALRHGNDTERRRAVQELGKVEDPSVVFVLSERYYHENGIIRHWIALSIGQIGGPVARDTLQQLQTWEMNRPHSAEKGFALDGIAQGLQFVS